MELPLASEPERRSPTRTAKRLERLKRELARYSASSIAKQAAITRNPSDDERLKSLERLPWLGLLLVKWSLQDARCRLSVGPHVSKELFESMCGELWDLTSPQAGTRNANFLALMRALVHVQIGYQRDYTFGFLRWPALFARLEKGRAARAQFVQVLGMEPDAFMDMAFATQTALILNEFPIRRAWFAPLDALHGKHATDHFLNLIARDLPALRAEMSRVEAKKVTGRAEIFEFPYLCRFPLLRQRDGSLVPWHPAVLARGLEDAPHLRLSTLGERYTKEFSRVFEKYVVELLTEIGARVISEDDIRAAASGSSPTVEAIVESDGVNILVEAKMSLFNESAMVADTPDAILFKAERVRKAINQGWNVSRLLRSLRLGTTALAKEDFLIVVTSRELNLGTGELLKQLLPPSRLEYPSEQCKALLPLSNVFVVSIEDFEQLCGCVQAGDVQLGSFLQECVKDNSDPAKAAWFLEQHLASKTRQRTVSQLLSNARDSSMARFAKAFPDAAVSL